MVREGALHEALHMKCRSSGRWSPLWHAQIRPNIIQRAQADLHRLAERTAVHLPDQEQGRRSMNANAPEFRPSLSALPPQTFAAPLPSSSSALLPPDFEREGQSKNVAVTVPSSFPPADPEGTEHRFIQSPQSRQLHHIGNPLLPSPPDPRRASASASPSALLPQLPNPSKGASVPFRQPHPGITTASLDSLLEKEIQQREGAEEPQHPLQGQPALQEEEVTLQQQQANEVCEPRSSVTETPAESTNGSEEQPKPPGNRARHPSVQVIGGLGLPPDEDEALLPSPLPRGKTDIPAQTDCSLNHPPRMTAMPVGALSWGGQTSAGTVPDLEGKEKRNTSGVLVQEEGSGETSAIQRGSLLLESEKEQGKRKGEDVQGSPVSKLTVVPVVPCVFGGEEGGGGAATAAAAAAAGLVGRGTLQEEIDGGSEPEEQEEIVEAKVTPLHLGMESALSKSLHTISFQGFSLSGTEFGQFLEAIKEDRIQFLKFLSLQDTGLTGRELEMLCDVIEEVGRQSKPLQIETLSLSGNYFDADRGLGALSAALSPESLPHLRVLLLANCHFRESPLPAMGRILSRGALSRLECLDLEGWAYYVSESEGPPPRG